MTLLIRELERTDSRVLGALRCVDATTGALAEAPLQVTVAQARVRRNRSGLYVIVSANASGSADAIALAAHESVFHVPPNTPDLGSVALTARIEDPSGRYLPRLAAFTLPRDPSPANAALADSLFRPIDVALYPASVAPLGANWSVLRISARESATGDALGGALLIVSNAGGTLARGLTDGRGEALVPVPGIPVTTWSEEPGAVVVSEITAQVQLVFDPATGTRNSSAELDAGRAPASAPVVNPVLLEAGRNTLPNTSLTVQLAAGRSRTVSFLLALP